MLMQSSLTLVKAIRGHSPKAVTQRNPQTGQKTPAQRQKDTEAPLTVAERSQTALILTSDVSFFCCSEPTDLWVYTNSSADKAEQQSVISYPPKTNYVRWAPIKQRSWGLINSCNKRGLINQALTSKGSCVTKEIRNKEARTRCRSE